ncbi:hypothetical protein TanjilG_14602 [Lupinus angustifolius]|uniref:(+)-neomenthol dehydrogenase n=1 Tax=Lupinus angustifolius TaxID=3871 RepID=A0A394DH15_LUPAN|nr:hypothetical protein TanjilG_14602 [Lupinus angustifolius]
MGEATQRYAVVTGSNKGIGFEIVRQLASAGIKVVLTARDEKRGLAALEKLNALGLSHLLLFHQLDVADAASVASLAHFVKSEFGKLDILIAQVHDSRGHVNATSQLRVRQSGIVVQMCRIGRIYNSAMSRSVRLGLSPVLDPVHDSAVSRSV